MKTAPADAPLEQLARLRLLVVAGLALGIAGTTAANILHAEPALPARIIAAWAPLTLLLVLEVVARAPAPRRLWVRVVVWVGVVVLGGGAAFVSYRHMVAVALRYGEDEIAAHLLPVLVDGLVVVMSAFLVDLSTRIRDAQGAERRAAERRVVLDALTPELAALLPSAMDVARGIAPNGTPPSQRQLVAALRSEGHSVASSSVGPLHAAVTAQWSGS